MISERIEISNKLGLHARASSRFVHISQQFESSIFVEKCDQRVDGKSMMSLLLLAAAKGSWVTLEIHGKDEQQAMHALKTLIKDNFGEAE
ncbi:MAG: HPr family phosphocarrier protein [bacterium]